MPRWPSPPKPTHAEIDAQITAFVEAGGQIQVVPFGCRIVEENEWAERFKFTQLFDEDIGYHTALDSAHNLQSGEYEDGKPEEQ